MKELTCVKYVEEDGSITLSLQDFDIVVNEDNFGKAIKSVINELKEYVKDYLSEPDYWSTDKERISQILKLYEMGINNLNVKEWVNVGKDKQYKAWEIIKMCQENELINNSTIIGKNFKEKASDLKEQNIGIDDLLISEPFTVKQFTNNNASKRYIFPKDVLVFNDNKHDKQLKFVVVTFSDGKHMDLLNLDDFSLEGFNCLFGDTLIALAEKKYEGVKFLKKVVLEDNI